MDDVTGTPPQHEQGPEHEVPVATGPAMTPPSGPPSRPDPIVPIAQFPAPAKKKKKEGNFLKELPILIIIAFGLALLIKTFLLQAFYIPSESMVPTLKIGDRVLVNKLVYRIHPPRRGDIIVFIENPGAHKSFWGRVRSFFTEGLGVTKPESRDFIKRVIGLPGETIQITNGVVNIKGPDGRSSNLTEPYLNAENRDNSSYGPFVIPPESYFVMGDNRANSADSRTSLGPVKKKVIIGRAFIRIWPLDRFGFFHRPKYSNATAAAAAQMAPVLVLGAGVVVRRRKAA
jgi:signal peptidase I